MKQFPDEESAEQYLAEKRWGDNITCAYCDGSRTNRISGSQPYKCRPCNKKFSVKTNTFMHGSPVGCRIWLLVMFFMARSKKGISSLQLGEMLGIRQPTIWSMSHRIRQACGQEIGKLTEEVEVDEAYPSGISRKRNSRQWHKMRFTEKPIVLGMKQRNGRVKAKVIKSSGARAIHKEIINNIEVGSTVYTDEHGSYKGLKKLGYKHDTVHHGNSQYVRGEVHTNNIENFWSVMKNQIRGTHHWVSKTYLQKYLDEITFRQNTTDFIGKICQNTSNG